MCVLHMAPAQETPVTWQKITREMIQVPFGTHRSLGWRQCAGALCLSHCAIIDARNTLGLKLVSSTTLLKVVTCDQLPATSGSSFILIYEHNNRYSRFTQLVSKNTGWTISSKLYNRVNLGTAMIHKIIAGSPYNFN